MMCGSNIKWVFIVAILFAWPAFGFAQTLIKPQYGPGKPEVVEHYATTTLDNGEVVPWFPIEEVVIYAKRTFKTEEDRQKYLRLRRNVIRVLPYAIYAQKRYEQLDRDLALANSRREEKRLIKECEREIKDKITSEVKNLSVSQGKILIKLIERQTGNTSYDLVKDMKGGISAFVYQGVAKIFGHNLKSTYDPQEDYEIENIIREYERSRPMVKR
ncbi:hypothetical protein SMI01S_09600 [Sphingobacterium mizutaii NBRC 14946 = DSM 11724]|uniref:DUF4294 domain-containing protein n=2 Tax=Sphingobacterium mizutaii TaxID=1010 RepID=A0AAJ4XBI6_9SPHI|nr:DUF4294 domain-containing protein [Sphingobacterium mizutaii]GEM67354.1 hypothetical protein SMI01S_09600 [Sphingobacterium mizutaii NBRC 14946 = DSM 11724]SDL03712.1 protein of unknown function [Sphingobacterium mizutaii]SNV50514.1 Uncharacterised protein [Sphingobacterium mizutaii]